MRSLRTSRWPGLLVVTLLLGLAAWTVAALQPPRPAPGSAPARDFSASRAFAHVQELATGPHVVGSSADAQVTDALAGKLTSLGLSTRVQTAVGDWPSGPGATDMASVRNVVAVLPGTGSTGRLFLMAHHDSVQNGPGASDDTAGVAAVLETVRALTAGPRLRNDVVVVLTDGEEACLCGAQAFAADHPLAGAGGVVLNLEARGTSGPPLTFETSRGNAALAARLAAAAPYPVASSVAVEVYRALPNDTDFTPILADGRFSGLNTAYIDGAAAYHTAQDTPERLNRGSLQALGDNTLALARDLGGADLRRMSRPAAADATYFPVLGRLAHYDGRLVWPVAVAGLAAVAGFVGVLRRRGISSLARTAGGAVLALIPLVLAPLGAQGLWRLLVLLRPGYAAMIDPWRPGWYRLAVVGVVLTVVLAWYAVLRRRIGPTTLMAGVLVWMAVLGAVLAGLAPGGSYLAAWPAVAGGLAGIAAATTRRRGASEVASLVGGGVAVVVLAPTAALFFPALGLRVAAVPGFVVTLLVLALLPAFELLFPDPDGDRRRPAAALVPAGALVVAVLCAFAGLAVDRFDDAHPVPSQLVYALDADRAQAWWASTETAPGAVTRRYVSGHSPLPVAFPFLAGADVSTGPARPAALPAPLVTPVGDRVVGARHEVTVRVLPRRPVRLLALDLSAGAGRITAARVQGTDVGRKALGGNRLRIIYSGPPAEGIEVLLTVEGAAPAGPLTLRATDGSDGLDGLPGYAARPAGVTAAGTHSSDLVLVSTSRQLG
ncbi:MAG: rane metallopeptidase [Frankiales bacterium]|nr:rane metallopeptidase [Frankiales bacterium]